MELKVDLLEKNKKSIFRIVAGVFLIICSCIYICTPITHREVRLFDWFLFGIYALVGIILVVEGLGGGRLQRFFGKAYILINNELISLKPDVFNKEQSVYWNNIKSIDYKSNKFRIEKTDDTNVIIDLSKFGYSLKNEMKETIDCIAKEKSIKSNI